VALDRREGEQVVEGEHAEAPGPLEQAVQELARGQGVVEGPVGGLVPDAEMPGQGGQLAVGDLVAHQAASQPACVDDGIAELGPALVTGGGVQEGQVEAHVVADDHGVVADELEQ
jgi:hypothetical protein